MRYHGIGGGGALSGFLLLPGSVAGLLVGNAGRVSVSGRTRGKVRKAAVGEVGPPEPQCIWRVGRRELPDL